jgi:O-antigen ligase
MPVILAALFFFAVLTLWVGAYWPVTVFQVGVFSVAAAALYRARKAPFPFAYPLLPLSFAVAWGLFQWLTGRTAYALDTQLAILRWTTFLAVFLSAFLLFRETRVRRWFRAAMLWFAFLVSILATVQTFTSGGKVFWLFPSGYTDNVMGPILSRNHYAAFVEAVLPIAIYEALRRGRSSVLYCAMAATLYASVIASASRAGTVLATAEFVAVIAIVWIRGGVNGRQIGGTVFRIAALLALFTVVVGYEHVWNRFWAPDPMQVRLQLDLSSLHMIAAHPWFGVGLGAWPSVYPRYALVDIGAFANQAHNDWLQWTAEGGLPFGLVLATLFIWCLRPAISSVWGLGVIAVFLHALVDYPFSRPALGSWPILILAMLAAWQSGRAGGSAGGSAGGNADAPSPPPNPASEF